MNHPSGQPHNFELLSSDGPATSLSGLAGLTGKLRFATARYEGSGRSRGGFIAGYLFTGTDVRYKEIFLPGAIARIREDGSTVENPWVTLPGEMGLTVSLHIDRSGVYGGDLIAATSQGNIWRIDSSATPALVANIGAAAEALASVPDDSANYGLWAGKILAGVSAQGLVYAVDAQGNISSYQLGISPQDIALIPANENLFCIDSASGILLGAPASELAALTGDILIAESFPGVLWRVRWTGTEFETSQVAQAGRFESMTFAPAGASPIEAISDRVAVVRHGPSINGRVEGSVRQLTAENVTLNGGAVITSGLLIPGTPQLILNGQPNFGGTREGAGSASPSNHKVTLNGNATLGHLVTRTDPIALPTVAPPPASAGTRSVTLNSPGQDPGDFATLRDLTLNGNAGMVAVPPGTYRNFTANGGSGFILGIAGARTPAVYNLNRLTLNGSNSELRVVGPVLLTLATWATLNSSMGASENPLWLGLRVASGGLTLNGGSSFYGAVIAPSGTVIINGNSELVGSVMCDRLTINGNGVLRGLADTSAPSVTIDEPQEGVVTDATDSIMKKILQHEY